MDFDNLIHKGIMDDDRWIKMPLNKQMGNIGAEISRINAAKRKNSDTKLYAAFDRALELIDLTVYGLNKSHEYAKTRELLRFREVVCDCVAETGMYDVSLDKLVDYCTQYVLIG
ncbi:MAG: hypothetical protein K5639_08080 [Eubacterium sp.]|nr:hypothetical protein [Eubacterium sp.]